MLKPQYRCRTPSRKLGAIGPPNAPKGGQTKHSRWASKRLENGTNAGKSQTVKENGLVRCGSGQAPGLGKNPKNQRPCRRPVPKISKDIQTRKDQDSGAGPQPPASKTLEKRPLLPRWWRRTGDFYSTRTPVLMRGAGLGMGGKVVVCLR